jgi:hypothetical protein
MSASLRTIEEQAAQRIEEMQSLLAAQEAQLSRSEVTIASLRHELQRLQEGTVLVAHLQHFSGPWVALTCLRLPALWWSDQTREAAAYTDRLANADARAAAAEAQAQEAVSAARTLGQNAMAAAKASAQAFVHRVLTEDL